jgi:hypothetical protein
VIRDSLPTSRDPLCGSDTSVQVRVESRGTDEACSQPSGNCTWCNIREDGKTHKRWGSEFELSCSPAFLAEAASPLLRISTGIRNSKQQRKHRDPKSMPHQPLTTIYACRIFMRQIFPWMWMREWVWRGANSKRRGLGQKKRGAADTGHGLVHHRCSRAGPSHQHLRRKMLEGAVRGRSDLGWPRSPSADLLLLWSA